MLLGRFFTAVINFFGFPSSLGPKQEVLDYNIPPVHHDIHALEFTPPGVGELEKDAITCKYPNMGEYEFVNSPDKRRQWLAHKTDASKNYNISTDYEKKWPTGVPRKYHITVHEDKVNLDGVDFPHAKLINGQWPGPWIQACWGDEVQVTVTNKLTYNGTAIHMHGIRMLHSVLNDGVPGVTQCPIPPGDSFTYNFTATQYGTTWYHSHYSLQYTDGVLGPLTIHGPASANYDNAIDPIILGDHNHRSAFEDYYKEQIAGPGRYIPTMTSILINGKGNYAGAHPERLYTKHVEPGKRKILRLINTSTDSTYVFSVDGHELEVIGADLVPIHPYRTGNITIGIGQRYHAILRTKEKEELNDNGTYWIRVQPAIGCHNFETIPDARQGILYYGDKTAEPPIPTTTPHKYDGRCRDEDRIKPTLTWRIPDMPTETAKVFTATVERDHWRLPKEHDNDPPETEQVVEWDFNFKNPPAPAFVNYMEPTALKPYGPDGNGQYPKHAVIQKVDNTMGKEGWYYMVIIGGTEGYQNIPGGRSQIPAAHPIHLHGHDFAVLHQSSKKYDKTKRPKLNLVNPPRRDVVLLPAGGYVVLAFKRDNPGSWILHCHIAWHASAGLAIQALEDVDKFNDQLQKHTPAWQIRQRNRTCDNWNRWQNDISKHHDPAGRFQDDSGI